MTQMTLRVVAGFAIAIATIGMFITIIYSVLNTPLVREPELNDLRSVWGIEIPPESTEINFQSEVVERGFIGLSFKVPPENLQSFVESVCDGKLYEGYNPFDTIDSEEPTDSSILIKTNRFTYYSYSRDNSAMIFGNRCDATLGGIGQVHQITVDKTNPELFSVRFEQPSRGSSVPTYNLGINYINPLPDFPLMIVGLQDVEGEYQTIHNELCIDTRQVYADVSAWKSEWEDLKGANVLIEVDSVSFPEGTISPQGRLIPIELLTTENALIRNNSYWQYCINKVWKSGKHQINISIFGSGINDIEQVVEFKH